MVRSLQQQATCCLRLCNLLDGGAAREWAGESTDGAVHKGAGGCSRLFENMQSARTSTSSHQYNLKKAQEDKGAICYVLLNIKMPLSEQRLSFQPWAARFIISPPLLEIDSHALILEKALNYDHAQTLAEGGSISTNILTVMLEPTA